MYAPFACCILDFYHKWLLVAAWGRVNKPLISPLMPVPQSDRRIRRYSFNGHFPGKPNSKKNNDVDRKKKKSKENNDVSLQFYLEIGVVVHDKHSLAVLSKQCVEGQTDDRTSLGGWLVRHGLVHVTQLSDGLECSQRQFVQNRKLSAAGDNQQRLGNDVEINRLATHRVVCQAGRVYFI